VGRELTDTAPLSRRRIVPYLTSKKANITRRDKIKKQDRAIKDIKFAQNLATPVHTQYQNFSRKIEHNLVLQKEQVSGSMSTEYRHRGKGGKPISLDSSETAPLERPKAVGDIEITVKSGVIRIAANQYNNAEDITLAFACRAEIFKFHYPVDLEITIEAITDTTYLVESISKIESDTTDAIMDWIIQLHIVRHETNIEKRLMKFFRLLTTKLGKRTSEGLLLEQTLSHARIAEIVGSTRSTVSRTISTLRKTQQIYIDELKGQIILPVD